MKFWKKVLLDLKQLRWQNFIFLLVAGTINAIGVNIFLAPVKLYDSGISGTSILLSQITPEYMTLALFLLILNVPLFLFGLKKQGVVFTIYSIFAVAIYSLMSWLINDVLPIDVSMASPLAGEDLLLCALFGGVISGLGSGLTIRYGGAIDGVEVMAVIFAKKLNITVGTFVMLYNILLYVICGFIMESWILPLYSIVTYAAGLKTVDFVVEGFDRCKEVMIITDKPQEISSALMEAFECGTTKISAKGGYSNRDKTLIYFVVNRFQIAKMRNIIHSIDPKAFVTISEVADVFKSND
ncbi:MAG: YitT family protein [Clostridia bacterium]|nr:YitT family protein [Clostridia bacterium]